MRWLFAFLFSLAATVAAADEVEYEIVLYLQPDRSGQNTQNKSIELDGDELTIEESGEVSNRYEERAPTEIEVEAIIAFAENGFEGLDFAPTAEVNYPKVEVQIEIKTESLEAEVTRSYRSGALPEAVMGIQAMFFDTAFD